MRLSFVLPLVLVAAPAAAAQVASEDFETANTHGWSVDFGAAMPRLDTGGNPGGRIEADVQSANSSLPAAMIVPTAPNHPWSGNFRTLGVTGFSFDRQVEVGASNFGTRPTVVLGDDNGTPDFFDDTVVFVATGDVFQFGMVPWARLSVTIPSGSTQLDIGAGWGAEALPNSPMAGMTEDQIWNAVIQDVDYVGIAMGRPWNGGSWFGAHLISIDNIVLENGGGSISTNYCGPGVPNSTGQSGTITATGTPVAAANNLTLIASDLPTNQFGIFIASRVDGFVPGLGGASNGNLCLGGTIGRFVGPGQILGTGAAGSFFLSVDLTAIPEGGTSVSVQPGDTWYFQAWHRDGVGVGSNLTDGIEINFS